MDRHAGTRPRPPSIIVAGHICLDVIPARPANARRPTLRSGSLELIGPATLAVGGCVGNTGIALHRLGLPTNLVARVGVDPLGEILARLVGDAVPVDAARLVPVEGAATSYSLIVNRPETDRAIEHFTGVNDTFLADDVPTEMLASTTLLHVGYPPLMAALIADEGRELEALLTRAHASGAMTSLDMASVRIRGADDRDRWRRLLGRVLPHVDIFMPSLGEATRLLGRRIRRSQGGRPVLATIGGLGDEMIDMGVAVAGVKLGEHGLYVRSGSRSRIPSVLASSTWADRELHSTVFEASVAGTVGAGDATIAGFLFGLVTERSPEDAVTIACAVGASSVEAADGTSGVPSWATIERRLRGSWQRRSAADEPGWTRSPDLGLRFGPRDGSTVQERSKTPMDRGLQ